jgi:hypothetical protein
MGETVFSGHGMHSSQFCSYVFTGQYSQLSTEMLVVFNDTVPLGHSRQLPVPLADLYLPTPHGKQFTPPLPGGQVVASVVDSSNSKEKKRLAYIHRYAFIMHRDIYIPR